MLPSVSRTIGRTEIFEREWFYSHIEIFVRGVTIVEKPPHESEVLVSVWPLRAKCFFFLLYIRQMQVMNQYSDITISYLRSFHENV